MGFQRMAFAFGLVPCEQSCPIATYSEMASQPKPSRRFTAAHSPSAGRAAFLQAAIGFGGDLGHVGAGAPFRRGRRPAAELQTGQFALGPAASGSARL